MFDVWLSMISGHGANPISFNKKKIKIERPEHLLTPHPPKSNNISFLPYPPTPQSRRHMCIKPYVNDLGHESINFL